MLLYATCSRTFKSDCVGKLIGDILSACMQESHGRCHPAMCCTGLVPPAAAVALLGKFGSILIVIIVLMAIT